MIEAACLAYYGASRPARSPASRSGPPQKPPPPLTQRDKREKTGLMLEIYKSVQGKLTPQGDISRDCWIHATSPSDEEIRRIVAATAAPSDFLTDPLDLDERSRIEVDDGTLLVVLQTPLRNPAASDVPFSTVPVGVIIKDAFLITVCASETPLLDPFRNARIRDFDTRERTRFVIQLFHLTAIRFLKDLKDINKITNALEVELHKSMRNEELFKLLNIEKSLVYFMTSVRANEIIMTRVDRSGILKLTEQEGDLLDDAITENQQAIQMTKVYSNILSGMMDAFASIISNNLNVVMKLLTSVTIILMIPNLLASIYGMNIDLPFQRSGYAFVFFLVLALGLSLISVLFFIKKKWF
jgi:magnesium transporter